MRTGTENMTKRDLAHQHCICMCNPLNIHFGYHNKPVPSPSLSQLSQPSSHLSLVISEL